MTTLTHEAYESLVCAANFVGFACTGSCVVGGFMAVTSGTLALADGETFIPLIDAFPIVAGTFYRLPFSRPKGFTVNLTGGGSGTVFFNRV